VRAELTQRPGQLERSRHAIERPEHGLRPGPLAEDLPLGEAVEEHRHRHTDGDRQRDRQDLGLQRLEERRFRRRQRQPGQPQPLDLPLGHQVRGHAEQAAEDGALHRDLGELERGEPCEVINLDGAEQVAEAAGADHQGSDPEGIAGQVAGDRGIAGREAPLQPPERDVRQQHGAGPADRRHLPGVAEQDPALLGGVDQPPEA
jgi:hypothetical protein